MDAARARLPLPPVRWAWLVVVVLLLLLVAPAAGAAATAEGCKCGGAADKIEEEDARGALRLKLIAVASILASGATGVLVPVLGRSASALRPDGDVFFAVKAFAAGVILATGMVHILPAAFDALAPPCRGGGGGRKGAAFPFAGLVAMCSAMATMMVDSVAAGYYQRSHFRKARPVDDAAAAGADDEEGAAAEHAGHVHVHTHATHGHAHGHAHDHGGHGHTHGHGGPAAGALPEDASSVAVSIRHRVISQFTSSKKQGVKENEQRHVFGSVRLNLDLTFLCSELRGDHAVRSARGLPWGAGRSRGGSVSSCTGTGGKREILAAVTARRAPTPTTIRWYAMRGGGGGGAARPPHQGGRAPPPGRHLLPQSASSAPPSAASDMMHEAVGFTVEDRGFSER